MKKLFTLFLAFVASAGILFADEFTIGELCYDLNEQNMTAEVNGYGKLSFHASIPPDYSIAIPEIVNALNIESPAEGYVTIVIEIPEGSACDDIALRGTLDGSTWTQSYYNQYLGEFGPTDVENCIRFELISGTTNMYKATFRLGENVYYEGNYYEEFLAGNIYLISPFPNYDASEGRAVNYYVSDCNTTAWNEITYNDSLLIIQSSGICYIHIGGWYNPVCIKSYNITVHTPEFCNGEFPIELVGSFEGWGDNPASLTKVSDGVYSTIIHAYEGTDIKVRGQGGWDREILIFDPEGGWQGVPNVFLPEDTNVVIDYTDATLYRWNICGGEQTDVMPRNIPNKIQSLLNDANIQTYRVTSIGDNAFNSCRGLTSITMPNSVTSIGQSSFENCQELTSITIPNSVTNVGRKAFYGCNSLTSITIPNSVVTLGVGAFFGCRSLTSITIPNSVTSIGDGTFTHCSSLTSMEVEAGNTKYDSRENCNAIIETATSTLIFGCQNTTIPNSVTSIGSYAFCGCSKLASITIPNSVTSISGYAFSECTGLTSVTCNAITPPALESKVFSGLNCAMTPLYVPAQSVEAYKAADQWKDFNIKAIGEDALPEIIKEENTQDVKFMIDGVLYIRNNGRVYDLNGTIVE